MTDQRPLGPQDTHDHSADITLHNYLVARGRMPIHYDRIASGHALVNARLNGVDGRFILDSGAGATVIHVASAEEFRLTEPAEEEAETGTGLGGSVESQTRRVDTFEVGGVSVSIDAVYLMDLSHVIDALRDKENVSIDGVIGQDVLQRHHAVIDIESDTLFLALPA